MPAVLVACVSFLGQLITTKSPPQSLQHQLHMGAVLGQGSTGSVHVERIENVDIAVNLLVVLMTLAVPASDCNTSWICIEVSCLHCKAPLYPDCWHLEQLQGLLDKTPFSCSRVVACEPNRCRSPVRC